MRLIITMILFIKLLGDINSAFGLDNEFILKCEDGPLIRTNNHNEGSDIIFTLNCGNTDINTSGGDLKDGFISNRTHNEHFDLFLNKCKAARDVINRQDIELWGVTNNLIHNANNPENVDTQVLIIQGRILDANCVPVSDATVRITQPNLMSKHTNYKKLTGDTNKNLLLARESTGTATAVTNNLGLFTLITRRTIVGKWPTDISLSILHPDFSNHYEVITHNSKNIHNLASLFPDLKIDKYIPLYRLDITLNELNKYRTF